MYQCSNFHRHINTLRYTLIYHAKLYKRPLISQGKLVCHLMTDLYQAIGKFHSLLIIVAIRENHRDESLTDYWSKDYYHVNY